MINGCSIKGIMFGFYPQIQYYIYKKIIKNICDSFFYILPIYNSHLA